MAGIFRTRSTDTAASAAVPGWRTTFNDMITLMMVFFVLMFALSSMDLKRFKHFQNMLQSGMGVLYSGQHAPVGALSTDENPDLDRAGAATATAVNRPEGLETLQQTSGLEAEYTRQGIRLTLNDELLFVSGSASITPQGRELLDKIAHVVKGLNRNIRVEGHTDDVPIATWRFPSNWELSTARAVNVVRYFTEQDGIPAAHLSAAGYGAAKPREGNSSARQRAKNRRVEITLIQREPYQRSKQ